MPLCLILSLNCSAKPCLPARAVGPPAVYLQSVPEPKLAGETNADLARLVLELRAALRLANSDKAGLRKWLGP